MEYYETLNYNERYKKKIRAKRILNEISFRKIINFSISFYGKINTETKWIILIQFY